VGQGAVDARAQRAHAAPERGGGGRVGVLLDDHQQHRQPLVEGQMGERVGEVDQEVPGKGVEDGVDRGHELGIGRAGRADFASSRV